MRTPEQDAADAVTIAWHAAANAISVLRGPGVESLDWPAARRKQAKGYDRKSAPQRLAGAVRDERIVLPQALFAWACARDMTGCAATDWDGLSEDRRLAFRLFCDVLALCDGALDAARARRADRQRAAQATRAPPLAAALTERAEDDRLDARLPDPLARVDWTRKIV